MTNLFLRAKHWQLFTLGFGAPFVFLFVFFIIAFFSIVNQNEPSPILFISFFVIHILLTFLSSFIQFGWIWSIATRLDELIPTPLKSNTKWFKAAALFPSVYIFFFLIFIIFLVSQTIYSNGEPPIGFFFLIFPLHFLSMACMFYCLFVSAKTIKTATEQRQVGFGDFFGEFFAIWFFPIGVWILQPTINDLQKKLPPSLKHPRS